jgi:energy-coupling factor transporter ATP-binding protein EcfA2
VTLTAGDPTVIALHGRTLLLLAGIPGAGKSTLLRTIGRSVAPDRLTVLDSDPVRAWLRQRLPAGTPYRHYRPLVHLWHRLRIIRAVCSAAPTVVVHLPATSAFTRTWLALVGLLGRRHRLLLWLDVDQADARQGQRERGRVLAPGGFRRHVRRAAGFSARLRAEQRTPGWRVLALDRASAARGLALVEDDGPGIL